MPAAESKQRKKLKVAAMADLHVHADRPGGHQQVFAEMSEQADIIALSGDLTNLGLPEEAQNLASDLAAARVPVVAVLGNHDHHNGQANQIRSILRRAKVQFLEEETFEHAGVGFAGVKGFGGGFGGHMLNSFGEEAIKHFVAEAVNESLSLENALKSLANDRVVVVLHYAPTPDTVQGEPVSIFPFMGCSRLAETLDRFDTIKAVFHGHAHHGSTEGRTPKGVPVYNCCAEVLQRVHQRPYVIVEV